MSLNRCLRRTLIKYTEDIKPQSLQTPSVVLFRSVIYFHYYRSLITQEYTHIKMWGVLGSVLVALLLCQRNSVASAAPAEWSQQYIDKEAALELYSLLQNYLSEGGGPALPRSLHADKRNSEIINSLLSLPKSMSDVGR